MNRLHTLTLTRVAGVAAALLLTMAGCGGDDGGGSAEGVPEFVARYEATCTDGDAFAGAAPYVAGQNSYPLALLTAIDEESYFVSDSSVREGMAAPETLAPDDAAEQARLQAISLVACLDHGTETTAEGTCEYEGDDGGTITLQRLDVTYTLTVFKATTAEVVGTQPIVARAADSVCPAVVSAGDDQTTIRTTLDATAIESALESIAGAQA